MKKLISKNYRSFLSGALVTLLLLVFCNLNYINYLSYYTILSHQYDGEIDKFAMQDSIMQGITSGLGDPHSEFMTKEEAEKFNQSISTSYTGSIGLTYAPVSNGAKVSDLIEGSPAYQSGIYPGDIITQINDTKLTQENNGDIKKLLKDKNSIKILRPSTQEELKFEIDMKDYNTSSVSYKMIDDKTGYIYISSFSNTSGKEFEDALTKIEENNIDKLIIDVRNNGGGEVSAVDSIANQIIYSQDPYLYMKKGDKITQSYSSKLEKPKDYEIVGVQNEYSASASEILMAAIKESNDQQVVGVNSYGKGSAQKQYPFGINQSYKVTVEHWFTPDDNTIEKDGVTPTKEIKEKDLTFVKPISLENELDLLDISLQVAQVNTYLHYLGYETQKFSTVYDETTADAVSDFQEKNGITKTGRVDSKTAFELYVLAKDAVKNPQYDPYIKAAMEV